MLACAMLSTDTGKAGRRRYAAAAVFALSACASAPPIALDQSFWEKKSARVAVATAPLPQSEAMQTFGNAGLLDVALAQAQSASLSKNLESIDISRIDQLPERLASLLRAKGVYARVLPKRLNLEVFPEVGAIEGYSGRDFASLASREDVDHVLVVRVLGVGAVRGYYAFIPATEPSGRFHAIGELVDIKTRKLIWRRQIDVTRPVARPWDQPPDYPNLVKAMDSAIAAGVNLLVADFSWFAR